MPAFDQCYDQVVRALQKDGWKLIQSPANIYTRYRTIYVDLEVSRGENGTQETVMLVEVKCFPDHNSTTRDLYISIGQYLVYRAMLVEIEQATDLYLSVPSDVFETIFDVAVMRVVEESQIKIVVIDLATEDITKWIE
jgi:XisH protein